MTNYGDARCCSFCCLLRRSNILQGSGADEHVTITIGPAVVDHRLLASEVAVNRGYTLSRFNARSPQYVKAVTIVGPCCARVTGNRTIWRDVYLGYAL